MLRKALEKRGVFGMLIRNVLDESNGAISMVFGYTKEFGIAPHNSNTVLDISNHFRI
jgi:hypothetical protein